MLYQPGNKPAAQQIIYAPALGPSQGFQRRLGIAMSLTACRKSLIRLWTQAG